MYFKVNAKAKSKFKPRNEIKGLILVVASFLIGYCLIIPAQSGAAGQVIHKLSFLIFGQAAYLIPLLLLWFAVSLIKPPETLHRRLDFIAAMICISCIAAFLSLFGTLFYHVNFGGWFGLKLNPFFRRLFGNSISLLITSGISLYCASIILRVSLKKLIAGTWHKLAEDYNIWQDAREELKKSLPPKIKISGQDGKPGQKQDKPPIPAFEAKQEPRIFSPAQLPKQTPLPFAKPKEKISSHHPAGKPEAVKNVAAMQYQIPSMDLLADIKLAAVEQKKEEHLANAELLTKTLADFDITSKVIEIIPGPIVTRYDMELAPGVKVQSVIALSENISLAMKSPSIRIVAIPEKSVVGVEVPNSKSALVGLKGILSCPDFVNSTSLLAIALGRTTDGSPYVTDLKPMPHLLVAGATGSGKSVGIHSIILSILYKARPDEVKFMLIDPKRLEMSLYKSLPHLYDPRVPPEKTGIITQPKDAAESLKKLVRVMENRYEKFAQFAVRNIEGYNEKMVETGGQKEFYIVVIIDELADLMLIASNEVEDSIQRLAQMARAVGIHLVLATQRPSVDVITGVIKANFPARIAFQTTSKVDSRVILDTIGAEDLLGKGDMLFFPPGESRPLRLQGAFVSVREAEQVIEAIDKQNLRPSYDNVQPLVNAGAEQSADDETTQELIMALELVKERKRVSQDLLKAHFGSSARATNLLSLLETRGFIHKPEGTNRWTIYFDRIDEYILSNAGLQPPGQEQ